MAPIRFGSVNASTTAVRSSTMIRIRRVVVAVIDDADGWCIMMDIFIFDTYYGMSGRLMMMDKILFLCNVRVEAPSSSLLMLFLLKATVIMILCISLEPMIL
mmetsp:Transcript_11228/g.16892  ORF Transcript_11228/g.16892 Transcript_11228/m.16892 type:complete len:102 (-) Transcript_11228:62-367(-)